MTFALAAAAVGLWPLADGLWQVFILGRLLIGAFALGPRPDGLAFGTGTRRGGDALARRPGLALARRVQPAAMPASPALRRGPSGQAAAGCGGGGCSTG